MTNSKAIERSSARDQAKDQWLQVTPGERFTIRVSTGQTMGACSVLEVVADPHNGVPLHIHNKEDEHFIVLDGTLDIAVGNRRWDVARSTRFRRTMLERMSMPQGGAAGYSRNAKSL